MWDPKLAFQVMHTLLVLHLLPPLPGARLHRSRSAEIKGGAGPTSRDPTCDASSTAELVGLARNFYSCSFFHEPRGDVGVSFLPTHPVIVSIVHDNLDS